MVSLFADAETWLSPLLSTLPGDKCFLLLFRGALVALSSLETVPEVIALELSLRGKAAIVGACVALACAHALPSSAASDPLRSYLRTAGLLPQRVNASRAVDAAVNAATALRRLCVMCCESVRQLTLLVLPAGCEEAWAALQVTSSRGEPEMSGYAVEAICVSCPCVPPDTPCFATVPVGGCAARHPTLQRRRLQ